VFIDLWVPAHFTSFVGYKYYVLFTDAYSRYTWIFPLKSKGETVNVFQIFKNFVQLTLGQKIKNV